MEILISFLFVLLPYEIFGQSIYRKQIDPNNAPFLPINPGYPYTTKVTKRGSEKEPTVMLNSELYAPRPDATDSYTSSFSSNQEKIPYFSGYGGAGFPGSGFPRAPYSPFPPYYGNNVFGLFSSPYGNPYASGINSGYFNEPPYFYQDYYNNPYNSYPPLHPEFHGPRGPLAPHPRIQNPNPGREYDNHVSTDTPKYDKTKPVKTNESYDGSKNESGNDYEDGNNLISENQKEVVAQRASSSSSINNERDKTEDYQYKISQLPPPTYKVISVGGQPVGPDYPLPESYTRAKLLEQVAAVQSLVKSLGPALTPPQMNRAQEFRDMSSSEYHQPHMSTVTTKEKENSMTLPIKNDYYLMNGNHHQVKINDGRYFPLISNPQGLPTNPHVYESEERNLPSKDSAAPSNQFLFNADLGYDEEERDDEGGKKSEDKSEDEIEERERNVEPIFVQSNSMRGKISGPSQMYAVVSNPPKTMTSISVSEQSQGGFISSENVRPVMEESSDGIQGQSPSSSSSSSSSSRDPPYRSEENYKNIRGRVQIVGNSYNRGENHGNHGVPQAYTYHHINKMHPSSRTGGGQKQEATNLEDVNFGTEQGNKG